MKTDATESAAGAGPSWGERAWAGGGRFWVAPGGPTLLGLIRICCGLVTFYTFVAYTFDLQALAGEHALVDLKTRQLVVREGPVAALPEGWGHTLATRPTEPG